MKDPFEETLPTPTPIVVGALVVIEGDEGTVIDNNGFGYVVVRLNNGRVIQRRTRDTIGTTSLKGITMVEGDQTRRTDRAIKASVCCQDAVIFNVYRSALKAHGVFIASEDANSRTLNAEGLTDLTDAMHSAFTAYCISEFVRVRAAVRCLEALGIPCDPDLNTTIGSLAQQVYSDPEMRSMRERLLEGAQRNEGKKRPASLALREPSGKTQH